MAVTVKSVTDKSFNKENFVVDKTIVTLKCWKRNQGFHVTKYATQKKARGSSDIDIISLNIDKNYIKTVVLKLKVAASHRVESRAKDGPKISGN